MDGVRSLATYSLDEDEYNVDFALMERYQAFSTELLRLCLVLLAAYGFLIKEVLFAEHPQQQLQSAFKSAELALLVGTASIGLAATAALAHRYFSTDGAGHQIAYLRLCAMEKDLSQLSESRLAQKSREHARMIRLYKLSMWCLRIAAGMLAVGTASVAVLFFVTLIQWN